jgi:RNA polymerase sigma-70 factor (ECF subfamily)
VNDKGLSFSTLFARSKIIGYFTLFPAEQAMTGPASISCLTSQSLLSRARHQDEEAWTRLLTIYGPLIYQWSRRCGLNDADSADIMQEVFGTLSRRIGTYQGTGRFRGWLWVITRNKVRDHVRRFADRLAATGGTTAQQMLQQVADESEEPSLDDQVAISAEEGIVARTLELVRAEFEPGTWQAFWLATVDKKTPAEVAETLGMSRHAVHQAKYRVTRRLREELAGLE